MHDPYTVAHEIKYPWWKHKPWPKGLRFEDISIYERDRFGIMGLTTEIEEAIKGSKRGER